MRLCLISPEFTPYAKTGGLGDVVAAIASRLFLNNHDLRVFVPLYRLIDREAYELTPVDFLQDIELNTDGFGLRYSVYTAQQDDGLWLYFVDCPALYDRPGLYTNDPDEHMRFVMLSRAAIESCQRMGWSPEIVQCHDWQAALVPLYLKVLYNWDQLFAHTRTVLTIHNIGYQGSFSSNVLQSAGLAAHPELMYQDDLAQGRINFLKTGVLYADAITTVSPTYATEIATSDYGMGLQALLYERRDHTLGILNGVDYRTWSPDTDKLIPHRYSSENLAGKRHNKKHLQKQFGLKVDSEIPLVGIVARLASQKGFQLFPRVLPELIERDDMQLMVLGSGDPQYEDFFGWLADKFPTHVGFYRGFHEALAHLIEAGSDMFLMPSLYEPCGLNQMYSLRYGTVPIVRKTGGLADTVIPHTEENGNGIVFEHADETGLRWAITTALELYNNVPRWTGLMLNGMKQDFSWGRQIQAYESLFSALIDESK